MGNLNTACFVGRLTKDPELKTTENGVSRCSFNLAVQRPRVKDICDFLPFVAWRSTAEYLCKYANKGTLISVTGMVTKRDWTDNAGEKHSAFEIIANELQIISNRKPEAEAPAAGNEKLSELLEKHPEFLEPEDYDCLPL